MLEVGDQKYGVDATLESETQYLLAGARLVWKTGSAGSGFDDGSLLAPREQARRRVDERRARSQTTA
jgi:hypothetical protein